ncbi:MAG: LysE family translocator [Anaerolineae bacterium]|nr:LysE family translocator [Anaerolineae bacterium]
MLSLHSLLLFAAASLSLLVLPGPVVLYTVARSLSQGRQAGLVSVLAAGTGDMCHALAATAGLSALLLSSPLLFTIVKALGAGYLFFIGLRTLFAHDAAGTTSAEPSRQPLWSVFRQGVAVAVLNPKTALFFIAFLPQFVEPGRGTPALQISLLGVTFVLLGVCTNSIYALASGGLGALLARRPGLSRGSRYAAGGVYITLGVLAALTGATPTA